MRKYGMSKSLNSEKYSYCRKHVGKYQITHLKETKFIWRKCRPIVIIKTWNSVCLTTNISSKLFDNAQGTRRLIRVDKCNCSWFHDSSFMPSNLFDALTKDFDMIVIKQCDTNGNWTINDIGRVIGTYELNALDHITQEIELVKKIG